VYVDVIVSIGKGETMEEFCASSEVGLFGTLKGHERLRMF
jgi:hypothetical protein